MMQPPTPDVVRAQLREAEAVLQKLELRLQSIRFDPLVPASVNAATRQTSAVIESLLSGFRGNPVLAPLVDQLKVQYLENIDHQVKVSRDTRSAASRVLPWVVSPLVRVWEAFRRNRGGW